MTRYRLRIEYDGRDFVGWQRQDNGPSIQAALEEAVRRFCGETVTVHGAGRTDAGVHALGQVAHFDLTQEVTPDRLCAALNHYLKPAPVAVLAAAVAEPDFHARFSATQRAYLYRIVNRRAPLALDRGRAWFVPAPLDAAAMDQAAQALVGRHDFTSFRSSECQAKSALKTLDAFQVVRRGDEIRLTVRALSFLHHQVRAMAGSLKLVGTGKWRPAMLEQALAARERGAAGPTAPAAGLYFLEVRY